jgi:hypothetical protein
MHPNGARVAASSFNINCLWGNRSPQANRRKSDDDLIDEIE